MAELVSSPFSSLRNLSEKKEKKIYIRKIVSFVFVLYRIGLVEM